jgi:hypothetical protein
MTRIRFEGLRSPALSALARSPVVAGEATPARGTAHAPPAWDAGGVLRLLRDPAVVRVVAFALVLGLVGITAPVLLPVVRWVVGLL